MSVQDRLLARFGTRRRAWSIRARLRKARFSFSRRAFQTSYAFEETSVRVQAIPYLIRNAILPVALALALVVVMDLLDDALSDQVGDWGWGPVSKDAYDALIETVAAVTGVFLALYFTAVSTVAASVYVNVPHDIRALIVRDRLGNVYVMGVAFTMALSVLLLIAHALTGRTYELGPPVIGVFAAFSIFAFISLGQRAFYLADPTLLSGTLAYDFGSWFKRATVEGRRWDDPNFQELYRKRAQQSVESMSSLLAIGADQPHLRGASVQQLTAQITGLLTRYLTFRDLVPTRSRWFGERYEHKQWYLTDGTELDSATATATALHPQTVPYVSWVEDGLIGPLVDLIDGDLKHEDFEGAYVALGALERVWTQLGERWSANDAARWMATLTARVSDQFTPTTQSRVASRPALIPAIWDALAMLPMAAELGFHRNVTSRSVADLVKKLETTDWSKQTAPYRIGVPRPVVGVLEDMRAGRAFERAVDAPAPTQTPNWYVRELALHTYERAFQEEIVALVGLLADWYSTTAKKLADARMPDAVGAVLSRGIECVWKLERHVVEWEQIATDLRSGPLLVDLVRPRWDWGAIRQKITDLRTDLLRQLSQSIPAQAFRQRDPEIPDYLGEAVHRVGEAAFEALMRNDDELFAEVFPTYLMGVLVIVDRIKPQVANWQPSLAATAISEPVADVMDLSGYAIIFSEFHRNPKLLEPCERAWRAYLGEPEGRDRLTSVAAMHWYQSNLFAITHRATARTRWQMAANSILSELPRSMPSHPFGHGEVQHRSALIRRIAPQGDLMFSAFNASDIFVVLFLRTLPGGEALDFGVADWIIDEIAPQSEEDGVLGNEQTDGETSPDTDQPTSDETGAGSSQ
jgi:hypothetical protein